MPEELYACIINGWVIARLAASDLADLPEVRVGRFVRWPKDTPLPEGAMLALRGQLDRADAHAAELAKTLERVRQHRDELLEANSRLVEQSRAQKWRLERISDQRDRALDHLARVVLAHGGTVNAARDWLISTFGYRYGDKRDNRR